MKSLALVMLVKNEEEFLQDALESAAPFVDSITIIDQESTDKTPWIARSFPGVRYIWHSGDFKTHGEKYFRDLVANITREDWILVLDADEILSDGWQVIRPHLTDDVGVFNVKFYHLMGSYEFHAMDSPHWCPRFIRNHPNLRGCAPMLGSYAHSNYRENYRPNVVENFAGASIFHTGYMKRDIAWRWEYNIKRGDYGFDEKVAQDHVDRFRNNPMDGFPPVKPLTIPLEQYPSILQSRVGRTYNIQYDPATHRLTGRTAIPA